MIVSQGFVNSVSSSSFFDCVHVINIIISEIYIAQFLHIKILNCALQYQLHIITPVLAELPMGAHKHYKE